MQRIPKRFKTLRMRLEIVDIAAYRKPLQVRYGPDGFKLAVIRDLEAGREKYCFGHLPEAIPAIVADLG